jgi:hypothetical protein
MSGCQTTSQQGSGYLAAFVRCGIVPRRALRREQIDMSVPPPDAPQHKSTPKTTRAANPAGPPEFLTPRQVETQKAWLHERGTDKLLSDIKSEPRRPQTGPAPSTHERDRNGPQDGRAVD